RQRRLRPLPVGDGGRVLRGYHRDCRARRGGAGATSGDRGRAEAAAEGDDMRCLLAGVVTGLLTYIAVGAAMTLTITRVSGAIDDAVLDLHFDTAEEDWERILSGSPTTDVHTR